MFSKTWSHKEKNYVFKLTRKAQIEIEKRINAQQKRMFEDKDMILALADMGEMEERQKEIEAMKDGKTKDKKLEEFNKKYLPLMSQMLQKSKDLDEPIELYEIGFILITNYPSNPGITKDEYDLLTADMEDKLGLIETVNFFKEMKDKVFLEMEQINQILGKTTVPENKTN